MGFTVPNGPDAPVVDQTEPDALDYEALGFRSSGVASGCDVTAQITPNMSVAVAAGKAVVDGVPVDVSSGSVTIQTSDATPRFDLIVVDDSGTKSAIRGTASGSNPLFPDCDLSSYALLAAVYVGASTASIASSAIVDKRVMLATTFRRTYTDPDTTLFSAEAPAGTFGATAGGKVTWVESTLQRLAAYSMELTSALTVKANDAAASLLTLKARVTAPENQKVLDVQTSGGQSLASISGTGVLQAANFVTGSGSPLGTVMPKGTLYIDSTTPRNLSLWVSEGEGSWEPFRSYDPSQDELPVGSLLPYLGSTVQPGWILAQGQQISATDEETAELADLVGTTYGTGTGTVGVPDFRGKIPIGAGGDVALTLGDVAGAKEVVLTVANLPEHGHDVTDPGHAHPNGGRPIYGTPTGSLKPTGDVTEVVPFALNQEAPDADRTSTTGITVGNTGSGEALSTLPPVGAINWMIKAHSTYARISKFTPETLVPVLDGGVEVTATIDDLAAELADQFFAPINNPTFTGNVVVPDANADGEALAYDQDNARLGQKFRLVGPSTYAYMELSGTANGVDAKTYRVQSVNGAFYVQAINDDNSVKHSPIIVSASNGLILTGASSVTVPEPTGTNNAARLVRAPDAATGDLGLPGFAGSDTGWRDVSGDLANDYTAVTAMLRRSGKEVTLRIINLDNSAATGAGFYEATSVGWRPDNASVSGVFASANGVNAAEAVIEISNTIRWAAGTGFNGAYGSITWTTNDAWPATLPGTQVTPPVSW